MGDCSHTPPTVNTVPAAELPLLFLIWRCVWKKFAEIHIFLKKIIIKRNVGVVKREGVALGKKGSLTSTRNDVQPLRNSLMLVRHSPSFFGSW